MSALSPEQSHDQNIKTLLVENPWAAITFVLPKCANVFRHEPEIEPIREETLKTLFLWANATFISPTKRSF